MTTLALHKRIERRKNIHLSVDAITSALKTYYLSYIARQEKQKIYWYIKAIIMIPAVYMVLSIMAMAQLTSHFEYYAAFTMLLFFANVLVHIAQLNSRIYVPVYHTTLLLLVIIPIITYFLT